MQNIKDAARSRLLRRGFAVEYATLAWNVVGIVVLVVATVTARSAAWLGFVTTDRTRFGGEACVLEVRPCPIPGS